jgi:hypothetical protein
MSLPRLGVDLDSDPEDDDGGFLAKRVVANGGGGGGGNGDNGDSNADPGGDGLSEFPTYEDYLDSQILPEDMKYLEVLSIQTEHVH